MSAASLAQMVIFAAVLVAAGHLLGVWLTRVYTRRAGTLERALLRAIRSEGEPQDWRAYAVSLLVFSLVSTVALYLLLVAQGELPLNPNDFPGVDPLLALLTSTSFVSSTNWQFYSGESTMSQLSQMTGLAVQNFAAPAVGLSVLVATTRAFAQRSSGELGNFWVDLYRSLVFVLLPLAAVAALVLVSQGTPQTLDGHAVATSLEGREQTMFVGVIGGAGTGVLSMLLKIVLAVFVAGLMIARTPQLLGKRIEAHEMKLMAAGLLFVPVLVLTLTAVSIATDDGRSSIFNAGAHGFGETLYAFTSRANNNGSAFAGFGYTELQAVLGTIAMAAGRFVPLVVPLALAGSLSAKQAAPPTRGTLRVDTPTFATLLLAVIVITSGLTLLPAVALGPLVEGLGS